MVGSPLYQTCVPCIGRWILNHWTTWKSHLCMHFSYCTEVHGMELRHFMLSTDSDRQRTSLEAFTNNAACLLRLSHAS